MSPITIDRLPLRERHASLQKARSRAEKRSYHPTCDQQRNDRPNELPGSLGARDEPIPEGNRKLIGKKAGGERIPDRSAGESDLEETPQAFDSDDAQLARANELREIGEPHGRVERLAKCKQTGWRCNDRLCRQCSSRVHSRYRSRIKSDLRGMNNPTLLVFRLFTRSLDGYELRSAIDVLRRGVGACRERFAALRDGAGMLEVALHRKQTWNVHLHLVVDADAADIPIAEMTKVFTMATGLRTARVDTNGPVRGRAELGAYLTKLRDRCPAPGTLPLRALRGLATGLKGRAAYVGYGRYAGQRGAHGRSEERRNRGAQEQRKVASQQPQRSWRLRLPARAAAWLRGVLASAGVSVTGRGEKTQHSVKGSSKPTGKYVDAHGTRSRRRIGASPAKSRGELPESLFDMVTRRDR